MALKLPPLSGLRLFEAATRCGTFKAAADELGLTPGALSHGIDSLEQWLDVELFERKTRGVVLTAAGRQYLPYVTEALSIIATGTLRLPSRRFEARLSISSAPLFAFRVLLPRLHKFQELYPNMQVKVDASPFIVQLPSHEVDVAIRNSRDAIPKMSCDLIGRIRFVPVAAPHYIHNLSRDGTLDWSRAMLIHTSAASEDWATWCNRTQTDTSSARKLVVSSAQVAFEAASDGLGIAIGRLPLIDDDIAAGRLAMAVDHVVPVMSAYWLVKPSGLETRREIVAFRNWLLKEMSQLKWNDHSERRPALKLA
ncbi:MAG TPA: LysR substrate-binding domain-containing protein [Xanthobacteraceae bacterium]|nr:LysR substrate-binding domain-containing protein [Xanthobacteraceae bacterium]